MVTLVVAAAVLMLVLVVDKVVEEIQQIILSMLFRVKLVRQTQVAAVVHLMMHL